MCEIFALLPCDLRIAVVACRKGKASRFRVQTPLPSCSVEIILMFMRKDIDGERRRPTQTRQIVSVKKCVTVCTLRHLAVSLVTFLRLGL